MDTARYRGMRINNAIEAGLEIARLNRTERDAILGYRRRNKNQIARFYFYDLLKYPQAAAYGIRAKRAAPVIPRPRIFAH